MKRRVLKSLCGSSAAAALALLATTALAGDLGLVGNGDMELESRFTPHGTPGVDNPNGFADGWHHSTNATWNPTLDGMVTSGVHSLYIIDNNAGGLANVSEEHRSFAAAIPGVGNAGRTLNLGWKWKWDITSTLGDKFSATVRISTAPVVGLDLAGAIADHVYLTDGTANSNGFKMFMGSIPLTAADQSFDIIFKSEDRNGPASETGRIWIDDVSAAVVPEPATLGLLGLGSLGVVAFNRRRRSS